MTMKKFLLPVDYTRRCLSAAESVQVFAGCWKPQVTVLHVTGEGEGGDSGDPGCMARADFFAALDRVLAGLNPVVAELPGDPAETIVKYAQEQGTDLILMPTRGRGALRRFLLGSVTAKVLHDAGCPVWTGVHMADEHVPERPTGIRNVACGVDLGTHSKFVLLWAADLAAAFGASLTVIHASTQLEPIIGVVHDPQWRAYVRTVTLGQVDALLEESGVQAESMLASGEPAKAVAAAIVEIEADVLVIGRAPDGLLGRLRTNAYSIICQSPCPVMSV